MCKRIILVGLLLSVLASTVSALDEEYIVRERTPGSALAAAFLNIVFIPVRFACTVFGGFLGGFTGFMTAGSEDAADDVWALFDGDQYLTPEMMRGEESLHFAEADPN